MTNQETIEKLNDALNQLIDAYEALQAQKNALDEKLNEQISKNKDLEFKLSDFSTTTDKQENKMDGMLSKIQKLLGSSKSDESSRRVETVDNFNNKAYPESILDIKLEPEEVFVKQESEKINNVDLGRMESLLNGLNNK